MRLKRENIRWFSRFFISISHIVKDGCFFYGQMFFMVESKLMGIIYNFNCSIIVIMKVNSLSMSKKASASSFGAFK